MRSRSDPHHRYKVGQKVRLVGEPFRVSAGYYEVLALVPPDAAGEFQYRIKNSAESHERVTRESSLSAGAD